MQDRILTRTLLALTVLAVAPALAQWGPDTRLTNDPASSQTSQSNAWCVAADTHRIHVVWSDRRDGASEIYYKRSIDYGTTWGPDTRLTNFADSSRSPSVAAFSGRVYVAWSDRRDGNWEIYLKRSTDGGATWGADTRLTINTATSDQPSISVGRYGYLVTVAWMDVRDGNSEIYCKRSTDFGATWTADTRVTNNIASSSYPSAAVALFDSVAHIVWVDSRDGNNEIYYKRSTDNGVTWGTDVRLTNNSYGSNMPAVVACLGRVHVTWTDTRDEMVEEVYYKRSTNNGAAWSADTRLTTPDSFGSFGTSIAASENLAHIVWLDWRDAPGGYDAELYAKRSVDYGATWEPDVRLTMNSSSSYTPSVTACRQRAHVVWTDDRDGNQEIYYKVSPTNYDVGSTRILAPAGTVDSGAVVTPACSTRNFGTNAASYWVKMRIEPSYLESAYVAGHAAGIASYVTFADWTASQRGTYGVACSTELAGDAVPGNDKLTGSVNVQVRDVGCTFLEAPAGTVDSGAVVVPACSVYNAGSTTASYVVRMRIGPTYNQSVGVSSHAPGTHRRIAFPGWTASVRGVSTVTCSTELAGDIVAANDAQTGAVAVRVRDAACSYIEAPSGSLDSGSVVTPACTVYNRGTAAESYSVRLRIGAGYNQTAAVSSHAPGTTQRVTFPAWTASPSGSFAVTCSTELPGDIVPGNDKLSGSVVVRGATTLPDTWTQGAPVPPSGIGKAIKDGGWLVYDASRDKIFAARGNKTGDFLSYVLADNTWTLMPSWPLGAEAKPPYKGAVGVSDGAGTIYATKGNNEVGFWKFSTTDSTWTQLADVPLGVSNKNVKGGTDLVYVTTAAGDYIYLLKGYKTEFYRYDVDANTWETLPDAPGGTKPKYDKGSWLAYLPGTVDAGGAIYAHKAKYHELYRFDIDGGTWGPLLTGMPLIGQSGKSKKSKDGGAAAVWGSEIFALKGGNTCEFWRYATGSATWTELGPIPEYNSAGQRKRVKAGGDIVHVGNGQFVVTKGNKSDDCWRIRVDGARQAQAGQERPGVMAQQTIRAVGFSLGPNPLASGHAVLRYSLPEAGSVRLAIFDIAGQQLSSRSLVLGRSGTVAWDLRGLAAGVYVAKLSCEGYSGSQKLMVER